MELSLVFSTKVKEVRNLKISVNLSLTGTVCHVLHYTK
jgi:hypothetical protein